MHRFPRMSCAPLAAVTLMLTPANGCAQADHNEKPAEVEAPEAEFGRRILREHGNAEMRAKLMEEYDFSDPRIEIDKLMAPGVPRDGIPALTDPERTGVDGAEYPADEARVVEVVIDGDAVAYPIGILNFHEIANDTVGGVPVAVTYCPLCDSAAVVDRRLEHGGELKTLEFGVSGFLYNSNVVMYERGTMSLFSQVLMEGVTGPYAGERLRHLPVLLTTMESFRDRHPDGEVLTKNTGHNRQYEGNPYDGYFSDPGAIFHDFAFDDRMPAKELGIGIKAPGIVVFVAHSAAEDGPVTVKTDAGPVVVESGEAGMRVTEAPDGVMTIQTFYHSWAAFHPETQIRGG